MATTEDGTGKSPRLIRKTTGKAGGIITTLTPVSAPPLVDTITAFEALVDRVRGRFIACFADEGLPMEIDLDGGDLHRSLWVALIHDGIADTYDGDVKQLAARLRGLRTVWLRWDFADDDPETLRVFLSVERMPLGDDGYEHFLDGGRWRSVALCWLLLQLSGSDVDAALRNARHRP